MGNITIDIVDELDVKFELEDHLNIDVEFVDLLDIELIDDNGEKHNFYFEDNDTLVIVGMQFENNDTLIVE